MPIFKKADQKIVNMAKEHIIDRTAFIVAVLETTAELIDNGLPVQVALRTTAQRLRDSIDDL